MKIKILNGQDAGKSFEFSSEISIGRARSAGVFLKDSKASLLHAKIFLKKEQVFLEDLNSTNGTLLNGENISTAVLLPPETPFEIGKTQFVLIKETSPEKTLSLFLKKAHSSPAPKPSSTLKVFPKKLFISFLSGPKKGEQFVFYYGPRFFGFFSSDFILLDKSSLYLNFQIDTQDNEIYFSTKTPEEFLLNGAPAKKTALKSGDTLSFGATKLKFQLKAF